MLNKIFNEENLLEIDQKLQDLPAEIKKAKEEANNFSELQIVEQELQKIEVPIMFLIKEEKDDKDKPKYSNEGVRTARLQQLLNENSKYQELLKRKEEIKNEKFNAELQVDFLYNTFSATKHRSDFIGSIIKNL